ncbi:GAF domain-containing protein [Modestobacter sp. DSM 44400]|uniref:GAF and ANTAR domain-containing protein n=1 Tax=Modestobacter sp. DSM 44400 TaxID=1550230 RepID=UPI00089A301E|nr:GAF and ANTAR domain-containing protein [Modestobacter sp. DSM 44400]SDX90435.1 GAF domain-containing protein [Modestobacter sp. DSM 44400]
MDPSLAAELTQLARLAEGDEESTAVLQRLVDHAISLVPGCSAAGLTVSAAGGGLTAAVSDERITSCHDVQFRPDGSGPAQETLQHNEPRRIDDMAREARWPAFRAVARKHGFASCLALPLRTDLVPSAALNLYADRSDVFAGTTHDVALLFAAQGGVALDNATLYFQSRELIEHLQQALATRGVVERARGLLMSQHHLSSQEAFALLRTQSQESHRKLRDVATAVLDAHEPGRGSSDTPWNPVRHRSPATRPLADDAPRT